MMQMMQFGRTAFGFLLLILAGSCGIIGGRSGLHYGSRPSFSPDGSRMVFAANRYGKSHVYVMNRDGSGLMQLTRGGDYNAEPVFSPDGSRIAFVSDRDQKDGELYLMDSDGSNQRRLTNNTFADRFPSFSPDGGKIVFARAGLKRWTSTFGRRWDQWDIYVINADGTRERRITNSAYYNIAAPHFSPDGETILYSAELGSRDPGKSQYPGSMIYNTHITGTKPPQLLTQQNGSDPVFSPDGKKITYISHASTDHFYNYEIFTMNADGSNPVQITRRRSYILSPVYSPDAKTIFFLSDPKREGLFHLFRVDADGSNVSEVEIKF